MNPLKRLNRSRNSRVHPDAHMTWASRSISTTVTRTGLYLQKQLWIWPIVAVVVLSTIGYFMGGAIETTIKGNVSSGMQTLVDLEAEMLTKWFSVQESAAEALANDATVRRTVYQLFQPDPPASPPASPGDPHKELAAELGPAMSAHDFDSYLLVDKSKRIVSATHAALVGEQGISEYESFLDRALAGEAFVSPPFPSVVMMKDTDGQSRMGVPTMYVCAPVRDPSFQVVGVLALQIRPEREFIPILQLGRTGASGETYAFNEDGIMISNSRFDEELILLGLLPDQPHSRSILQMSLRDPGADMTEGFRPNRRRSQLPLTTMAADAIAGNSGLNVDGYRDYRGVNVIGAWRWLPKYKVGVAIEVDADQAFRPIVILQRTFLTIFVLLLLCAIVIFVFTLIVARLQRQSREAVIEAQQLGQYTLDHKLGEGAMGVVYKGHHSMLRRPTAIKLLHADKVNDTSIARFEREVQITCQLNHANTIAIYDYGRTPEGVFYYAMEYLDGIDLQDLVDKYGTQSEARVIHILLQICGSLFEAHSQGLVHRDIKPANVMLNRRGCEPDVVKVLDFGLVKAVDRTEGSPVTDGSSMSGTPLYMSPESIQAPMTVDACSDIYAVGAVGYFLLTGKPVFEAANLVDLCQKHIEESPVPPTKRSNVKVSSQLEDAIMGCLEKSRAKRPQTARDLGILISKCAAASQWTIEEADRWWGRHERGSESNVTASPTPESSPTESSAMDATMDQSFQEPPNDAV
ncbi:serine/threonine protein kinase [Rhodopirellula islandica]|uniref:serine/threonine protein kinase n=1 Tax=Rhodopirellula islandica TaxID=595434 RepID=UPI00064B5D66|nr:serine/threonine protein kinase [Rhodopirellula islandica]